MTSHHLTFPIISDLSNLAISSLASGFFLTVLRHLSHSLYDLMRGSWGRRGSSQVTGAPSRPRAK